MRLKNLGSMAAIASTAVLFAGCPDPRGLEDEDAQAIFVIINPEPLGRTIGEGESQTFTVKLSRSPDADISVRISSSDTDAFEIDVTEALFTVNNFNNEKTVTVTGVQDDDARNETVTLTIEASGFDDVVETVTVTDDDALSIVTSTGAVALAEGTTATVTVQLSAAPDADTVITVASADDGAVTPATLSLTFTAANWNMPQNLLLTAPHDSDPMNEATTVSLSASGLDGVTITATVEDDDDLGIVVGEQSVKLVEGRTASVAVWLGALPSSTVAVSIVSSDPDAADVDTMTLVFGPTDWDQPKYFVLDAMQDIDVLDEEVVVTLAATGLASRTVDVDVDDDDVVNVVVTPGALTVPEGGFGTFTINLDFQPPTDMVISVESIDLTTATVMPATLTFTPQNYDVPQTVQVDGTQDMNVVDGVTAIRITAPGLEELFVQVTVTDDDSLSIVPSVTQGVALFEGGTARFSATLAFQPPGMVMVAVASDNTGVATVSPAMLLFSPQTWNIPQTITIQGIDDANLTNDPAVVTLTAPGLLDVTLNVLVNDNDTQAIIVDRRTVSVDEGQSATVQVNLQFQPANNVTISVASFDPGAASATPQTLTFTPTNYDTPQTVTITGAEDVDLSDESAIVTLNTTGLPDVAIVVNVNDDDQQAILLSETALTVVEGQAMNVGVTLAFQPRGNVNLFVASSDLDAARPTPNSLTFTPQNYDVPQQITIRGVEDQDVQDENASVSVAGSGVATQGVNVTVTDDDTQGVFVSATTLSVAEGGSDQVRVNLAFMPSGNVTVDLATANAAVATVSPPQLVFTPANYAIPRTVFIAGAQDDDTAANQTTITVTSQGLTDVPITVDVQDDDVQRLLASVPTLTLAEGGQGTIGVTLAFRPQADVTVTIASSDAGAATVAPPQLVFTPAMYNVAQNVTVTGIEDADLLNEAVLVTMSSAGLQNIPIPGDGHRRRRAVDDRQRHGVDVWRGRNRHVHRAPRVRTCVRHEHLRVHLRRHGRDGEPDGVDVQRDELRPAAARHGARLGGR